MRIIAMRVCAMTLVVCAAQAQEYRATMTGRVIDTQGALVPNAKVVATELATKANHETVSSTDGQYTLPFLPPGDYRVAAEMSGFKRYVREGEQVKLQYRCEFFNGLNHPQFDGPQLGPTNTNFGNITSQSNLARSLQMALRMTW